MDSNKIYYIEKIPAIQSYWELFQTTGWNEEYGFTIKDLHRAILNSWYQISAFDNGRLIGSGRIISDGVHHAFIVDLIVHPDCQGIGTGGAILRKLIDKCKQNKIRDIQLFAAENKFKFYEAYGFERRKENAPGMEYK